MILDLNFSRQKFLNLEISWLWTFSTWNIFGVVQPSLMICDLQWAMINDLSEPYLALRTCFSTNIWTWSTKRRWCGRNLGNGALSRKEMESGIYNFNGEVGDALFCIMGKFFGKSAELDTPYSSPSEDFHRAWTTEGWLYLRSKEARRSP